MSYERPGQDFVIARAPEAQHKPTPNEMLAAETQRIVDETWQLYLDIAEREPDIDMMSLLELDPDNENDRDGMAEIVEERISDAIYAWVDDENQSPAPSELALILKFLGVKVVQPLRGDIPLSDFCLLQYVAYTKEQSRLALAASEADPAEDRVISAAPEQPQDRVIRRTFQG